MHYELSSHRGYTHRRKMVTNLLMLTKAVTPVASAKKKIALVPTIKLAIDKQLYLSLFRIKLGINAQLLLFMLNSVKKPIFYTPEHSSHRFITLPKLFNKPTALLMQTQPRRIRTQIRCFFLTQRL